MLLVAEILFLAHGMYVFALLEAKTCNIGTYKCL